MSPKDVGESRQQTKLTTLPLRLRIITAPKARKKKFGSTTILNPCVGVQLTCVKDLAPSPMALDGNLKVEAWEAIF